MAAGGISFDPTKFKDAQNRLKEAMEMLVNKSSVINSASSIAESYDGKGQVNEATGNLISLVQSLAELYSNMNNTLGLMGETNNYSPFEIQLLGNISGVDASGNVTMQYYSNGVAENYNAVCDIVGGSAQGKDFCLATARIYCQLVCREKFGTNEYANCNGYSFSKEEDALEYVKREINSGYPVMMEVDNRGENKVSRHFVMAFAVSEDGNDVMYLDPVAGEIKKLGESWQEYQLMSRKLYDEGKGYWIGSFSGSNPSDYGIANNGSLTQYQGSGEQIDDCPGHEQYATAGDNPYHNPYKESGFPYQASVYLSNGSTVCGNGIDLYANSNDLLNSSSTNNTNQTPNNTVNSTPDGVKPMPIVIDIPLDAEDTQANTTSSDTSEKLAPSLNGYYGPYNMPWIAPGATHDDYQYFLGGNVQNI